MATERTPIVKSLKKGEYAAPQEGDVRGPCPLVNCLANHGYIDRTGRNIRREDLDAAMDVIGLSPALGAVFANPIFNEHIDPKDNHVHKLPSLWSRFWAFMLFPWSVMSRFGLRSHNQVDAFGVNVVSLDRLATPGVIEHDISLTRRDYAQDKNNCEKQEDLVNDLLHCSKDGSKITRQDFAELRKRRIQCQLEENPQVDYNARAHTTACTEISLILGVFGSGNSFWGPGRSLPCSYAQAIFKEERLPVKEGWTKRGWFWPLGFLELKFLIDGVKKAIGLHV